MVGNKMNIIVYLINHIFEQEKLHRGVKDRYLINIF